MTRAFVSSSELDTEAVGARIAETLRAGDVLLISGELGAGKTALVRGLARGLGIDPAHVSSPTFALIHEYSGGRLVLHHADLYRLSAGGADDLGLEEAGARDGVLAIEWPERLRAAPVGSLHVRLALDGGDRRQITLEDPRVRDPCGS